MLCGAFSVGWAGAPAARPGRPGNRALCAAPRNASGASVPRGEAASDGSDESDVSDRSDGASAASARKRPHRNHPLEATAKRSGGPGGARSASRKSGPNAAVAGPFPPRASCARHETQRRRKARQPATDNRQLTTAVWEPTAWRAWRSRCRHGGHWRRPSTPRAAPHWSNTITSFVPLGSPSVSKRAVARKMENGNASRDPAGACESGFHFSCNRTPSFGFGPFSFKPRLLRRCRQLTTGNRQPTTAVHSLPLL